MLNAHEQFLWLIGCLSWHARHFKCLLFGALLFHVAKLGTSNYQFLHVSPRIFPGLWSSRSWRNVERQSGLVKRHEESIYFFASFWGQDTSLWRFLFFFVGNFLQISTTAFLRGMFSKVKKYRYLSRQGPRIHEGITLALGTPRGVSQTFGKGWRCLVMTMIPNHATWLQEVKMIISFNIDSTEQWCHQRTGNINILSCILTFLFVASLFVVSVFMHFPQPPFERGRYTIGNRRNSELESHWYLTGKFDMYVHIYI